MVHWGNYLLVCDTGNSKSFLKPKVGLNMLPISRVCHYNHYSFGDEFLLTLVLKAMYMCHGTIHSEMIEIESGPNHLILIVCVCVSYPSWKGNQLRPHHRRYTRMQQFPVALSKGPGQ